VVAVVEVNRIIVMKSMMVEKPGYFNKSFTVFCVWPVEKKRNTFETKQLKKQQQTRKNLSTQ
jgi:hypothetical protein